MAVNLSINGVTYPFPEQGDEDWGLQATDAIVAITNGMLQKAGGNFTLLADTNFGATYGLISTYFKSRSSNIADSGVVRLANNDLISWRNGANSANIGLTVDPTDKLLFNGSEILSGLTVSDSTNIDLSLSGSTLSASVIAGSLVNTDISNSAAIAQSKLNLSITNTEINASAAIAYSKLALSNSIINSDISSSAAIAYSKLALSNSIVNSDISSSAAIAQSKLALSITNTEVNASAAIARSKLASGSNNHVVINDGSGVMSSEATLAKSRGGTGADNSSVTFPTTGTIVTRDATETLTNKTLTTPELTNPYINSYATFEERFSDPPTPGSQKGTLFLDGGLQQFRWIDDGGVVRALGGGGGAGAVNFITNPDAENDTSGWNVYADAAGPAPVDGTGGITNVTWTRVTGSPMIGTAAFLFTKDAANRQGQGVSTDFTIDNGYLGSVVTVSAYYAKQSGTFAAGTATTDSDLTFWIIDKTTGIVYQPSAYKLLSNSLITDKFQAEFQVPVSGNDFRLCIHCSTTSTSAYTVYFDEISVSPAQYAFGSPVSDWAQYTPSTTQGFGTTTSNEFFWRRVGASVEIRAKFVAGTVTASEARIGLPNGLTSASSTIIPTIQTAGLFYRGATSANTMNVLIEPSVQYLTFSSNTAGTNPLTKVAGNAVLTSAETATFFASVPIAGQSSSVQMADQTSTRVVSFNGTQSSQAVTANTTNVSLTTVKDSHASWATNIYTVPVAGDYMYCSTFQCSGAGASTQVYKNGTAVQGFGTDTSATGISTLFIMLPNLIVGDTISVRSTATNTLSNGNVSIVRISGPSQIASNETIAAKAAGDPASASSGNPIIFPTTTFDTHNQYNATTGRYTCPVTGIYQVFGFIDSANTGVRLTIYKNASIDTIAGATDSNGEGGFNGLVSCVAGDILDIRPNNTLDATSGSNINFVRIGLRG